ncbi:integrase core domain-containing protein [Pseudooceanicola onchidii]|uniref:integrase core domain-containing protein n=1 Tax=Pseudooceanicola onchidii TaxID=2562279 RepID=UPI0010AA1F12
MNGRRTCYKNSMVEAFFNTIKSELIWPVAWQSRQPAENVIARYIHVHLSPIRPHSLLGYQSPNSFARKARK